MIKESKYIIRRILIGVGIVLVLSMINSCKVKALENKYVSNNYSTSVNLSTVSSDSSYTLLVDYQYIKVFKNENSNIAFCNLSKCRVYDINRIGYSYTNIGVVLSLYSGYPNSCGSYPTSAVYLSNGNFPKYVDSGGSWNEVYTDSTFVMYNTPVCSTGDINSGSYYIYERANMTETSNTTKQSFTLNNNNGAKVMQVFASYNWNYYNNYTVSNDNIINVISSPEFVSWNYTKNTSNNVITGYTFSPEFSNFDTENYTYYYKFGNSNWLTLTENEQNININANGTIYVKIVENSSSNIIDSATFTITDLGTFYDPNVDYNIKITGEYRTGNQLNNSSSSNSSSIIMEYQLYIDYFPKSSILKYQYQYVLENNSLDSNAWETLASSNNGSRSYVVSQNGTLYARILDSDNNVVSTSTFVVNSIGKSALDNNSSKLYNFFDSIRNKIDFGGPIGSLVNIPITFLQTISNGFNGATGVCTDYNLGNLWGTTLILPCVNVKHYLGTQLYTSIDIICACCMFYMIVKMLTNAYYKFLLMEHTPVEEHIGRDY